MKVRKREFLVARQVSDKKRFCIVYIFISNIYNNIYLGAVNSLILAIKYAKLYL